MTINTTFTAASEVFWFLNSLATIPVSYRDGADELSVIETWVPFGDSPPLHIHHTQDEVFIVLKGQVRLVLDGRPMVLNPGDRAMAPKGVAHTYRVESAEGAHMIVVTKGGDFETMVRKASRPADRNELPPQVEPTPEMIAGLTALCAASRIDLVGPPLM